MRREFPEAPIVGVGAVLVDQGRVLLARRGQQPLKGEWSLPGGVLELGETLADAVVREVWEETGLVVEPGPVIEILDRIVPDEETGRVRYHYVLVDFLCRVTGGQLCAASDAEQVCWASREDLPQYRLSPVTLRVIEKAFALEKSPSENSPG